VFLGGGVALKTGFPLWRPTRGILADLRLASRRLYATPLFTIFAVLSLAIGLGVTTAVYSVVDSIFLRDLGIADPDRVVFVVTPYDGRFLKGTVSRPDFEDLRAAQTSFSGFSASALFRAAMTTSSNPVLVSAEAVDGAYFSTLGVGAQLGRVFDRSDDLGEVPAAILSHPFWLKRFGGNPQIVSQTVRLSGHPFQIIGIAAATFDGINGGFSSTDVWIHHRVEGLLSTSPPSKTVRPRDQRLLVVFGRLAPSVSVAAAEAQVKQIGARLDVAFPAWNLPKGPGLSERPWRAKSAAAINEEDNGLRRLGLSLMALIGMVLVVACTNLANLILARGTKRRQEIAVRSALGASRFQLVREQCAESLLLAFAGALISVAVFQGLCVAMNTEFAIEFSRAERLTLTILPTLNSTVLGIAAVSLLFSLGVFGLEPALQLTKTKNLLGELTDGASGLGSPRTARQGRLLRWQVAVSAAFFIIATMFVRYIVEEARHDPGIEMSRLGVAVLNFEAQGWSEERVRLALDRVLEEAKKDSAIEEVSASTGMPFGIRSGLRVGLSNPDVKGQGSRDAYLVTAIAATPSIFKTLGIRILRGRAFDDRDRADAPPAVVLSEFAARKMFGTIEVAGRQLIMSGEPSGAYVIGVAADTDVGRLLEQRRGLVYLPLTQRYDPFLSIAVRSRGRADEAVQGLRAALHRADPDLPVALIGAGRQVVAGRWEFLRALGLWAVGLGALTLALAMVGLFGIETHIVSRRTREIGVRMSFGASAAQIKRMVLKDGSRPVFEGLVLGMFMGLVGRSIIRSFTDLDLVIVDYWTLLVPIPLILSAYCACYLPASRAAAVDPSQALRSL
jgi:predicted permease